MEISVHVPNVINLRVLESISDVQPILTFEKPCTKYYKHLPAQNTSIFRIYHPSIVCQANWGMQRHRYAKNCDQTHKIQPQENQQ